MADRKDNINEQQAEQKLREEIREEMKNADQTPAEEHYSLNDDRRVKVLSPGMLVAKRFIRNRMAVTGLVILIFMFVFSFIGGLVSPYGQDQFFYTDKTIRKSFGEAKENTEFRYGSNSDELFGLTAQAKAMLPEGHTFKSVGRYQIEEDVPAGNSAFNRNKTFGQQHTSFVVRFTEDGKETESSAGKTSYIYYEAEVTVEPDGTLSIEEN